MQTLSALQLLLLRHTQQDSQGRLCLQVAPCSMQLSRGLLAYRHRAWASAAHTALPKLCSSAKHAAAHVCPL